MCAVLVALAASAAPPSAQAQDARREEQTPPPPKAPTLTRPPALLEGSPPEYPAEAIEAGLEASVKVRIHIDATGAVTKVEVLEPVGSGFDEAAVAAASKYVFSPAEWDGVPGAIAVETAIHFVLEQVPVDDDVPATTDDGAPPAGDAPVQGLPSEPGHAGIPTKAISIAGVATERGTRKDLAGVIVSIASEDGSFTLDAVTDAAGRFFFHGVPQGSYRVIAIDDRFDRFSRSLSLAKSERLDIVLWMRPRGGNPYETIVEGEREVLEVTRRRLNRQQLTSVPGTFGDPIRVIQSLPGLARTPFVTGFLVIRGGNPDDSAIFIDGHRVPLIFHFLGGPSILSPEFLEAIDLYPGGFPARFGRASAGVVSVETRSSKSDGVHGSADIDLLDAGGYLRFPVGNKGSFAIAGRRSYLDFMLGFFLPEPDPGDTLIVVPVYYDYQARFDYDLGKEGKLSLFYIKSSDQLEVVQAEADEDASIDLSSAINFSRLIATYKRSMGGDLTLTLSPAIGRDSVSFGGGQVDAAAAYSSADIIQNTLGYRMRINGRLNERLVLDTGLDIESRVTKYDLLAPVDDDFRVIGEVDIPPEVFQRNIDVLAVGAHLDLGIDATSRLRLIPGLRVDGYLLSGKARSFVDPRLVGRYQVNAQWTAKGYAGMFHQPPQPEAVDSRFGNPSIQLEKALHFGLGGEYQPTKLWKFDGEVYYINRYDLVHYTPDGIVGPDGEVTPLNFVNSGVSDTYGFEVLIKREVSRNLFGWLSYTFSHTRQQRNEDAQVRPTAFDSPHTLNLVASYKTDGGWEFGTRFRLSSGRPITPVLDSTFDADSGGYRPLTGDSRSARTKTFHQLDGRIEKSWLFNTWSIGAYLDVQNVLNVENVEAIEYDYRYKDSAPVTSVPFLPTIGVRGSF